MYWRREKAWADFSMMIPKINSIWLWNVDSREKPTHIHTLPAPLLHAQPWHPPTSVVASRKALDHWGKKAQNTPTDKRELTGLKPLPKHSSHKGHTNTSELKSIWFC